MGDNEKKLDEALAKIETSITEKYEKVSKSMDDTHARLAKTVEKQAEEMREHGGTLTATSVELKELTKRYESEIAELKEFKSKLDAETVEIKEALKELEAKGLDAREWANGNGKKDLFDFFAESDEWKKFDPSKVTSPLYLPLDGGFSNYSIDCKTAATRDGRSRKDITSGLPALREVLARNEWTEIFGLAKTEPVRLRDYMTVESADGNSYSYIERVSFENNAGFQTAEGELKNISNWTYEDRTAGCHIIAHGTTISRQQARQLPSVINSMKTELIDGLYDAETEAILFADGTGGSFVGIMNHPRIQHYAETVVATDTAIDVLRRSEDPLMDLQLESDLFVLNHRDWTNIELLKDDENRYLWVNVQIGGSARMWRKPVLATRFMPRGEFINGGFRKYSRLLDFERANLNIFPQHKDYPQRNLVFLLAEEEIGLAVRTPEGYVIGNLDGSAYGSGS